MHMGFSNPRVDYFADAIWIQEEEDSAMIKIGQCAAAVKRVINYLA